MSCFPIFTACWIQQFNKSKQTKAFIAAGFYVKINCIKRENISTYKQLFLSFKARWGKILFWGKIDFYEYGRQDFYLFLFLWDMTHWLCPQSLPWPLSVCLQARLSEEEKWLSLAPFTFAGWYKRLPHAHRAQEHHQESCSRVQVRNSRRGFAAKEMLCCGNMWTVHVNVKIVRGKHKHLYCRSVILKQNK